MSVHPPLFPLGNAERWLSYLEHCLGWDAPALAAAKKLVERRLIPVVTGSEIALFLGVSRRLVGHMVAEPWRYYRAFSIKKRSGEFRQMTAPRVFLKTVQRYILDCILNQIPTHRAAVGFKPKCSVVDGARLHVGQPFLWNIDVKDFFPSITQGRVIRVFMDSGFPEEAARFLARLCCLNGVLPQGAPTSPAISNLVFLALDEALARAASDAGTRYTRYADDMTFSSGKPIGQDFRLQVTRLLNCSGFQLNTQKSRLMGPLTRREVTGLTVNERVSVPRLMRRNLRARFYQVSLNPGAFSGQKEVLNGYALWLHQYHPAEAGRYKAIVERIPSEAQI